MGRTQTNKTSVTFRRPRSRNVFANTFTSHACAFYHCCWLVVKSTSSYIRSIAFKAVMAAFKQQCHHWHLDGAGQPADANTPDLIDGVQYAAVSHHMGSGMFTSGSQNMTQGWKGKQIVQPEHFGETNSSTRGFPYGG